MTSERPYRERMSVGVALQELIRMSPQKYDAQALQALLIQVRRDAIDPTTSPSSTPDWSAFSGRRGSVGIHPAARVTRISFI